MGGWRGSGGGGGGGGGGVRGGIGSGQLKKNLDTPLIVYRTVVDAVTATILHVQTERRLASSWRTMKTHGQSLEFN